MPINSTNPMIWSWLTFTGAISITARIHIGVALSLPHTYTKVSYPLPHVYTNPSYSNTQLLGG